ncbi:hypothetical protein THRCLA_21394 [Thraustotheca clavata]|uniref:Uncharacterized protein n=1 Tax=Thraustotheca clavata TaxID=74557 RepID=A0A1V9ZX02_9STRA|nr:hypothetical protein THRCLA_21394 [Thraustotheca clavata]
MDAEALAAQGNDLYKSGDYVQARKTYTKALSLAQVPSLRSRIFANRCQTYLQERDFALALKDAKDALVIDPLNVKAQMRKVLALENLENFELALEEAYALLELLSKTSKLQDHAALMQYALTTKNRLRKTLKVDQAAAKAQAYDVGKLVHAKQSLRLNYAIAFPRELLINQWLEITVFLANEFGLFQRGLIANPIPLLCELHRPNDNVTIEVDPALVLGINGKATFQLRMKCSLSKLPEVALRVSLAKSYGLDDVLAVVTLPIQLLSQDEEIPPEPTTVDPLGIQCCRSVYVDEIDKYITLAESPGHLGIAGKLWDSALILTTYLARNPHLLKSKRVLEVGSGLGLVGMVCAFLGAKSVTLTDMDEVVPMLNYNIRLNNLQKNAVAKALCWGSPADHLEPPFDVVVMSDVVYDPTGYSPLVQSILDVSVNTTKILMAHRSRHPQEKDFFDQLDKYFTVKSIPLESIWAHESRMTDVQLLDITRE